MASIIHQQLNRESKEGDVFIVLSKDRCKACLFSYDYRSYSLFEKSFAASYKFMKVVHAGMISFTPLIGKMLSGFLRVLLLKVGYQIYSFVFN